MRPVTLKSKKVSGVFGGAPKCSDSTITNYSAEGLAKYGGIYSMLLSCGFYASAKSEGLLSCNESGEHDLATRATRQPSEYVSLVTDGCPVSLSF